MPAFFTHVQTGDCIREKIENQTAKAVIENNKGAFYSGTQGADYLYFYKYYCMFVEPKIKMLGYAMHHMRPQMFFVKSAQYIKEKNSDVLKAFIYGYVSHYCLDRRLHPVISAEAKSYSKHLRLEHDLDSMYLKDKFGLDATKINRADILKETYDNSGEIDDFVTYIAGAVYNGFTVKEKPYTLAYKYYAKMNNEFFEMSKKKYYFYKFFNFFMQINIFSVVYLPLEKIKSSDDFEKYYKLIDIAIEDSLKYIDILDDYFNGTKDITSVKSAFYNVNFNGETVIPFEEKKEFKKAYKKCKLKRG